MTFDPGRFAADWARAWNRRDLDAVLIHFDPAVTFSSPTASQVVGQGTVTGLPALRSYWEAALARITTLEFTVVRTFWEPSRRELGIVYDRAVNGRRDRALELLQFSPAGLILRGEVFYGVFPST